MKYGPWELSREERERLDEYARFEDLVSRRAAQHDKVYQRELQARRLKGATDDDPPQMYMNIPGLVAKTAADMMLSEAPRVKAADGNGDVQKRIDALLKRSRVYALCWRALYWVSVQGDAFFYIADVQPAREAKALPVITLRRATGSVARNVRPEDPPFTREFLFRSTLNDKSLFLLCQAGKNSWSYFDTDGKPLPLPEGYPESVDTKELEPLAVHLAALRGDASDAAFGESDSKDAMDPCFEIANRWRQVGRVLDKHSEPPMNLPVGAIDENGRFDPREKKAFERDQSGQGAEYITWQSQLAESYTEIENLLDWICLLTETPKALWGKDSGGQAESGRALFFKMLTGLGKSRRNGGMFQEALAQAVVLALRREDILSNRTPGTYSVDVTMPDSFLVDDVEVADWAEKLRRSDLLSTRRGVEYTQGLSGQALETEVAELQAETAPPAAPLGFDAPPLTTPAEPAEAESVDVDRIPLAIQQLSLAKARAQQAGDAETAAQIGVRINGLLAKLA